MEALVVTTRRNITMMEALVIVEVQKDFHVLWTQRCTRGSLFFKKKTSYELEISVFIVVYQTK